MQTLNLHGVFHASVLALTESLLGGLLSRLNDIHLEFCLPRDWDESSRTAFWEAGEEADMKAAFRSMCAARGINAEGVRWR